MTLEQLIAQFRVDSDDQSSDPLSSDEQVTAWLNEAELDRIVGSLYTYTEAAFPSLLRLAFASKFS